jgi:hypothetical protein
MSEPLGNGIDTAIQLRAGDREVMSMVDQVVDAAVAQGNLTLVTTYGMALRRQMQTSGLALAKLLYRVKESWGLFQAAGLDDEFIDVIYAEMGVAPGTTTKYVALWEALFANPNIPIEVKENLEGKPMRSLILLTASARDEDFDWTRVVDAATPSEIREIVRAHRGQQTSSGSALRLEINLRDGKITARKEDQYRVVGMLLVKDYKKDPLVASAIDRIIGAADIMEK